MMYPMVQHQQQHHHQQQQQQQEHHQQIQQLDQDPEECEEESSKERQHRSRRPLYRRFFNYVREAWTGVKFALDSELEDLETPPRYRPDSLEALCRATRFTQAEIKRIYRGFKAECPTGVVREETFKMIYAQFFPQGANTSQYAHYVFNTLDQDHSGLISFEDFVQNLSILSRGSLEEKLRWAFTLYDINGDGYITREEMTDIVNAVYDLMGKVSEPCVDDNTVKEKVDRIFQKMDKNKDGVVTLDEFLECCQSDADISSSMAVFDSSI
ncbi:Kv channel-interacting protein 1-like isoform X2 [Harmonia axyridis]|uniref:Kv channel-interacting protein 1-like isoform X2 n=1 Tax=Harmonia axyridis TaxID=115357 RepID=UPI001E2794C0|nr:Kv channel-interacting protein 1-like isoform X2 [Harmonia axyridis]XP_045465683.1 Kv channel-interacting protein 1-like isoform X2 [Harmonia axyridis]XP_045465684.1 Kv channel-interacting protein 1-like isoform X2 [Harmonia axyridis]